MQISPNAPLASAMCAGSAGDSLFCAVRWREDRTGFSFELNPDCSLLAEHFPDFPVAPASLIVDLLGGLLAAHLGMADGPLLLDNVRFNRPVSPSGSYECRLQMPGGKGLRFSINGPESALYTRGVLRLDNETGGLSHAA